MATLIRIGHSPTEGFRNPDSDAAKRNWVGCQIASVSAGPPDMDRPTTALPVGSTPLLAFNQAGNSRVRNVSHL